MKIRIVQTLLLFSMLLVVYFPVRGVSAAAAIQSVTQPIIITTPIGSSAFAYTVSGCNVSPSFATSSAMATDFVAAPSCALIVSMPAASATARHVFAADSSTSSVATCGSGTCVEYAPAIYYQLAGTYTASSQQNFPVSATVAITGTRSGTVRPSACSIVVSGVVSSSCPPDESWFDYGTPVEFQGLSSQGTSTVQFSAAPLTYGLIGYWPLDEGSGNLMIDSSGHSNTGTLMNSPKWDNWTNCKFGGCLTFSGANGQHVSVPDSESLHNPQFTVSFWVKRTDQGSLSNMNLVSKCSGVSSGFCSLFSSSGSSVILQSYFSGKDVEYYLKASTLTNWNFATFSYDGTYASLFWNGLLRQKTPTSFTSTLSDLLIGGGQFGDLVGSLDDIRIYNHALQTSEISELYSSGVPDITFADITGGNVHAVEYFKSLRNSIRITPEARATFDDSLTYAPTLINIGFSITPLVITTVSGDVADTATVWSDYGKPITSPVLLGSTGNNVWENAAGTSSTAGTPSSSGNIYGTTYDRHIFESPAYREVSLSSWSIYFGALIIGVAYTLGFDRRRAMGYFRRNWGAPFVMASIVFLVDSAIDLSAGALSPANVAAVYAFCSLILGVVLQVVSYSKYRRVTAASE